MRDIVLAIIGSGTFFTFIIFLIQRMDNKKASENGVLDVIKELKQNVGDLKDQLNDLKAQNEENQAKLCRTHILRFADEIRNGIDHSEEYFRQQLADCDYYENYCAEHKSFANGYTVVANKLIHEKFEELYKTERRSENGKD